jgi:hypothetical protein
LPEGEWKLASYTIDRTGMDEKDETEPTSLLDTLSAADVADKSSSLLDRVINAFIGD